MELRKAQICRADVISTLIFVGRETWDHLNSIILNRLVQSSHFYRAASKGNNNAWQIKVLNKPQITEQSLGFFFFNRFLNFSDSKGSKNGYWMLEEPHSQRHTFKGERHRQRGAINWVWLSSKGVKDSHREYGLFGTSHDTLKSLDVIW